MTTKFSEWAKTVLPVTVLVSALVSGGVSAVFSYVVNSQLNRESAERSFRAQQVISFTANDSELTEIATEYIAAVNDQMDIRPLQTRMRTAITKQIQSADNLKPIFGSELSGPIEAYQDALATFAGAIDDAETPLTMRTWSETLGRVYDERQALTASLIASVDADS